MDDLGRETWKLHPLYKESRATLLNKCTEANLISSGKKYDLVQQIVENQGKAGARKLLTEADLYGRSDEVICDIFKSHTETT